MSMTGAEKQALRRDKVKRINHTDIRICMHNDLVEKEKKRLEDTNRRYCNKNGFEQF